MPYPFGESASSRLRQCARNVDEHRVDVPSQSLLHRRGGAANYLHRQRADQSVFRAFYALAIDDGGGRFSSCSIVFRYPISMISL
jgi:hypothetical protein